ncbi:MAG: hypothetical protein Q9187_004525, partial [Circinaria calcarea]
VWTLQEAVLAKSLYVQFADGALDVREAVIALEKLSFDLSAFRMVYLEASIFYMGLKQVADSRDVGRVIFAWSHFAWRSTSRAGDDMICLATILGLNTKTLFDVPVQDRMKAFLSLQRIIPRGLLFHDGARMREKGYRWAPASMRETFTTPVRNFTDRTPCIRDETGLSVEGPGFVLFCARTPAMTYFFFLDIREDRWYILNYRRVPVLSQIEYSLPNARMGVILEDLVFQPNRAWQRIGSNGILVTIQGEKNGVLHCTYICNIKIESLDNEGVKDLNERQELIRLEKIATEAIQGGVYIPNRLDWSIETRAESRNNKQKWCVG